jgi:hypothetical protein
MPEAGHTSHGVALIAGRYELIRELRVTDRELRWEAFDTALERRVLLEFPPSAEIRDGFWQQARAAARSSTAAGERVLDAGTDPETGRVFLVREWPHDQVVAPVAEPVRRRSTRRYTLVGATAVLAVLIPTLRPGLDGWLAWVNAPLGKVSQQFVLGPAPTAVSPSPTVAAQTTVSTPTTAAATPPPTPTVAAANKGVPRRVVNTDGRGVALRATAGGDRLPGKGYDEGAIVTAFERSGEWTHIRGSDGREGWVLSVTLEPPTP